MKTYSGRFIQLLFRIIFISRMQSRVYDFSSIRQLLVNPDKFKQTSFTSFYCLFVGMELDKHLMNGIALQDSLLLEQFILVLILSHFHWKDQMAECTNECILLMFISHAPTLFVNKDIDYYVLSSLMKGFRNILMILSTKPKFQPIQYNTIFMQIVTWFFFIFLL